MAFCACHIRHPQGMLVQNPALLTSHTSFKHAQSARSVMSAITSDMCLVVQACGTMSKECHAICSSLTQTATCCAICTEHQGGYQMHFAAFLLPEVLNCYKSTFIVTPPPLDSDLMPHVWARYMYSSCVPCIAHVCHACICLLLWDCSRDLSCCCSYCIKMLTRRIVPCTVSL